MNPSEPAINASTNDVQIFEPFGQAFELMKKILFQPFDLAKWCGIAFAAFLAGHFGGGVGFSPPLPWGNVSADSYNRTINYDPHDFPWLIGVGVVLAVLALAFIIFVIWIRSRGIFIYTDCIVRNRAAIQEPWREYRREGNSYFIFTLVMMMVSFLLVLFIAAVWVGIIFLAPERLRIMAILCSSFLTIAAWILFCILFALINYFMPMIMYAQRCGAKQALRHAINLISARPIPFVLFVLFGLVLLWAFLIVGVTVSCSTCCLASLPYVGTVIMLPVFVWLRGFGLLFLRQFGPDFDVWREIPPTLPPLTSVPPA